MDYLKLYDLEQYLFNDVHSSFHKNKKITAFDFFCIIIWKANRAKSKVALKLLAHGSNKTNNLNKIVENLTSEIANARDEEQRMRILIEEYSFRLPMASAILTVLFPDSFTVYDIRVCNQLDKYHNLQNKNRFEELWEGYKSFLNDVKNKEPLVSMLRDKDRTLWAKSFEKQLINDIETMFKKDD